MTALPPPAATLVRGRPTTRLAAAPGGTSLHVLAAGVTRCGHQPGQAWDVYGPGSTVPARRLCARCLGGLPLATRRALVPTADDLRAVHELRARVLAQGLVDELAALRTTALVDGSAYEATHVVEATLAPVPTTALRRFERNALPTGYRATARELTLLELLNELDPTRPDLPGHRRWVLDSPTLGSPVEVGGHYDARAYMGRTR